MAGLAGHLARHLPPYAVPLFIRIQPEANTTGTFKFRKVELVEEGFDLDKVGDPIWFLPPGASDFGLFDDEKRRRLIAGEYRL